MYIKAEDLRSISGLLLINYIIKYLTFIGEEVKDIQMSTGFPEALHPHRPMDFHVDDWHITSTILTELENPQSIGLSVH